MAEITFEPSCPPNTPVPFMEYLSTENTDNTDRLLAIFPEEIWLMIINCLDNRADQLSVSNASPLFHRLLQPKRVDFLFLPMWDVVGVKFHRGERNLWYRNPGDPPDPEPRKWHKEILMLRQVKKTWEEAINQFYFLQALPAPFATRGGLFVNADVLQDIYWCETFFPPDYNLIANFIHHFEPTHPWAESRRSPFLSRRICFYISRTQDIHLYYAYRNAVTELLEAYGSHILICEFVMYTTYITKATFSHFQQWMSLLPNLVCLHLRCFCRDEVESDGEFPLILELEDQILPKLEQLMYLNLMDITPEVANIFVRNYNHLSILHLYSGGSVPPYEISRKPFPNLRDLALTFHTVPECQNLQLARFNSLLTNLKLTFFMERPPLPEMFGVVASKWPDTLRTLIIFVYLSSGGTPDDQKLQVRRQIQTLSRQHLPRVKKLEIYVE